jgi:hypothetical protein
LQLLNLLYSTQLAHQFTESKCTETELSIPTQ